MPTTILLVDDNRGVCFALTRFLSKYGYTVDSTAELLEAQQMVEHGDYDALVTDLRLSGEGDFEGFDLLRTAREVSPRTRCILLSGYLSDGVAAMARELGAAAVVRKSVPLATLVDLLPTHA